MIASSQHTEHASVNEGTNTITCTICGAGYAPSYFQQGHLEAATIEAGFMSICHFCFRCRRPACPNCWDAVHGVCGACVQEAQLPFRAEVPPLADMAFPPAQHTQNSQNAGVPPLFICVYPGKFQDTPHSADSISSADTVEIVALKPIREHYEVQHIPQTQEHAQERPAALSPTTQTPPAGPTAQTPTTQTPPPGPTVQTLPTTQTPPIVPEAPIVQTPQADNRPVKRGAWATISRAIDRTVTVLALLTLLAIVVLVLLAEYSPTMNSQIYTLVHIDIRKEIAYLWHLIHQIF